MLQSAGGISFFTDGITFSLRNKLATRKWLGRVARSHKIKISSLTYVFVSDSILAEMNYRFLNHNTLTDVITFPRGKSTSSISGEIYISIDRIRENAKMFDESIKDELARVMAHGLLHLCGFKDKTAADLKTMRRQEEKALDLRTK